MLSYTKKLHQPIAVFARRRVVKQAELCHAFAGEIAQHHAAAMITVAGDEDPFERPPCSLNDVTAVLGGRRQSCGGLVAVIGLAGGKRTGGHEHRDVPAELPLATQLLCRALGMCADCLTDAVQLGGLVAERAGADDLLLRCRKCLHFDVKTVVLGRRGCCFRPPLAGIHHIVVPAPIFQGFSRVSEPEQIGLRGKIAAAGAPQVFQMLAQFTGRPVFAAAFEQPGDIHGDASGKSFLFLVGGQPADQEQIFGVGCANDAVLAGQPQYCQSAERQVAECGGGVIRSNGFGFV